MVESKYNTETLRNRQWINMFQEGPLHKPFFIAIDNWEQVITGPSKKTVAIYMVGVKIAESELCFFLFSFSFLFSFQVIFHLFYF